MTITTDRLLLRDWHPEDRAPFAALNADPQVMRYFPAPLTRAESDALAARAEAQGVFAVESREDGEFIGYVGLAAPTFDAHFTPVRRNRLASRVTILESRLGDGGLPAAVPASRLRDARPSARSSRSP